jgi:uncharacterized protein (TIGR02444 family)
MIPESPFWDFSLRLYAKAGVPDACLALQARHGIDVNLLFCCLWLGLEGARLGRSDIARLAARVRDVHEGVVKPLRGARTLLKRLGGADDGSLRPALAALRNAIKKSELDAEHIEQVMLGAARPTGGADLPSPALANANAQAYLDFIGARPTKEDKANLALIVAALPQAGSAKLADKGHEPDRKRPLARPGEGGTI